MISQKSIQEVYAVASVEDVIQDFVELRKRGVNMLGLCPFHDEKTPSFTVSPAKNIYKCFGCGKGGDAVRFVMDHQQQTYPEAIRWLANRYNIELEETVNDNPEYQEQKQIKESLQIINDFAQEYFEDKLWNHVTGKTIALPYFKERGFREATIKKFGLGFALEDADDFTKQAVSKKYNIEYLRSVGLTSKNDLDFFRNRVMFTIHNLNGKPIAFAGRTLVKNNKKIPKYINSPETPLYDKSNTLYGLHLAKNTINKENNCFMVEGYTDVISLHQGGIENVVASSGTSLTDGQIKAIKRYSDTITLLYDGDAAGIKAALRGLDLILMQNMNVFLVTLPESHDPDSYLQAVGKQSFEEYIANTKKDFVEYKAHSINEEFKEDPIGKAKAIGDVIRTLTLIPDSLKRTIYIQRCAEILNMQEMVIQGEVAKALKTKIKKDGQRASYNKAREESKWISNKPRQAPIVVKAPVTSDIYQERDLARICISQGDQLMEVDDQQVSVAAFIYASIIDVIEYFENTLYKELIIEVFTLVEADKFSHKHFIHHQNPEIQSLAVDVLTEKYEYASWKERGVVLNTQKMPNANWDKDSYQAILRFKYKKVQKIIKELVKKITTLTEENNEEELKVALLAFNALQEEKMKVADALGVTIG